MRDERDKKMWGSADEEEGDVYMKFRKWTQQVFINDWMREVNTKYFPYPLCGTQKS